MTFEMKQLAETPDTLETEDTNHPHNGQIPGGLELIGTELSH